MLDDFAHPVERKVWENKNGAKLLTVTGLLGTGNFEINRKIDDNGTVILECKPTEE